MKIDVGGRVELEILRRLSVSEKRSPGVVLARLLRDEWARSPYPEIVPGPVGVEAYFELDSEGRMTAAEARAHYLASGGMPITQRELCRQLREIGGVKIAVRAGLRVVQGWAGLRRRQLSSAPELGSLSS